MQEEIDAQSLSLPNLTITPIHKIKNPPTNGCLPSTSSATSTSSPFIKKENGWGGLVAGAGGEDDEPPVLSVFPVVNNFRAAADYIGGNRGVGDGLPSLGGGDISPDESLNDVIAVPNNAEARSAKEELQVCKKFVVCILFYTYIKNRIAVFRLFCKIK